MSALLAPITITADAAPGPGPAQPMPRGAQWLDVATAAERMDVSPRRIAQLAAKWQAHGTAKRDGRKWLVREDADPLLARVLFPEAMPFDWNPFTDAQRAELQRRRRVVEAWGIARADGFRQGLSVEASTGAFLVKLSVDQGITISASTLYAWHRGWRDEGTAGLVDQRWAREGGERSDPFLDEVKRLYLSQGKRLKLSVCHTIATLTAEREGWAVRSYKACLRMVKLIPQGVLIRCREGAKAYEDKAAPHVEREAPTQSNAVWIGDHHQLDIIVIGPNGKQCRPWLTAWMDGCSRVIVGWTLFAHDPNSDTILESFRQGVMKYGVPEAVYVDNGRDYQCAALGGRKRKVRIELDDQRAQGVFGELKVERRSALPYNARAKTVERFFRTLAERFSVLWPTWTGNSTQNKPADLADRLKAGDAPKVGEVIRKFAVWIEQDYHHRHHTGESMDMRTPAEVFTAKLETKRTAPQDLLDLLCLRLSKPVKVGRNGVTYNGLHYVDKGHRLTIDHLGKLVRLRVDDRDRSRVIVFDEAGKWLCVASAIEKVPFMAKDSAAVREGLARSRKVKRATRDFIEEVRPRQGHTLTDHLNDISREKAKAAEPPESPTLRMVNSPLSVQVQDIEKALKNEPFQQAVGAEAVTRLNTDSLLAKLKSKGMRTPAAEAPASIDPLRKFAATWSDSND